MSPAGPRARSKPGKRETTLPGPRDYWRESESPLASLIFLLPLILIYECGSGLLYTSGPDPRQVQVTAFLLIREFFELLGAHATHWPAISVGAMLLAWHLAIGDSWRIRLRTFWVMGAESVALALPLLLLGLVMPRSFLASATGAGATRLAVIYCGAGVYEEFVFRLILIAFLSLILTDCFRLGAIWTGVLIVLTSGLLFSAYHYLSEYEPAFDMRTFVFRSVAGIYFSVLFLTRGFGITAASHTAYNLSRLMLLLLMR